MASKLSPEDQFVLLCLKASYGTADITALSKISTSGINWNKAINKILLQGLGPLLYNTLNNQRQIRISEAAFSRLKNAYHQSLTAYTYRALLLGELLAAFHEKGIDIIVLKGAALAETVYNNPALRVMSDVDILVRKAVYADCEKVMDSLGYKTSEPYKSAATRKLFVRYHSPIYSKADMNVEIHWDLISPSYQPVINTDDFITAKIPVSIQKIPCYIFSKEYQFLHLCIHWHKHFCTGNIRLNWLADISAMILHPEYCPDWNFIAAYSEKNKLQQIVFETLYLLEHLVHIPVSGEIGDSLSCTIPANFEEDFIEMMQSEQIKPLSQKGISYRSLLKSTPGIGSKISIISGELFPSFTYIKSFYRIRTSWLSILYYPVWHLRIIRKIFRSIGS